MELQTAVAAIARAAGREYTRLMPSHVAHLLFAEDSIARSSVATELAPLARGSLRSYLVLGAQGPDLFYHNQRRKPTGLAYGSLMHRKRYGTAVAAMWRWARAHGLPLESWAGSWIVGFASHAILDRHAHPFINTHAGWTEPGDPDTDQYRSMHPFLERLIDVELLRERDGRHPNEIDFYGQVSCGDKPPENWLKMMSTALAAAYDKAARDDRLRDRLVSAYLDTMGYYRFTNRVDRESLREALARAEAREEDRRWLSIVHPPQVPPDVDVLNRRHREWVHPCDESETSTESFLDCYARALDESSRAVTSIATAWELPAARAAGEIAAAVKDWNLSDGRPTERPCAKRFSTPLPLARVQERIWESIRAADDGSVPDAR